MTKEVLHINGVEFLTRKCVMDMFQISNVTMAKWIKNGTLRHHRIGKNVYFIESEIAEDIKNSGSAVRKSNKEKVGKA